MAPTADHTEALAYCRTVLLPIWERWTDGNLAMRRTLDCQSADRLTHEEYRNRLFAAQQAFHGRGETPDNLAASIAAQAVQFALLGYPVAMVRQVGEAAEEAHGLAMAREVERRPGPEQRVGELPAAEHPQS